jgi:uncharacterized membrane protein YccC
LTAVLLGALAWGALVGLLESWRHRLPPGAALAFVVFLGLSVAAGFERDFVHASATIVQQVIVLLLVLALAPLRSPQRARARAARTETVSHAESALSDPLAAGSDVR